MLALTRTDTSLVSRWWWTVDRWSLLAICALITLGSIFILAASPAVAERVQYDSFYFARRQVIFLVLSVLSIVCISFFESRGVRRLAIIMILFSIFLMIATLIFGVEKKGATRWLMLMGSSIQPSEFIKPAFAVIAAWLISAQQLDTKTHGFTSATLLYLLIIGLLLAQPDVGMTIVVSAIWCIQIFVAGLSLIWVVGVGLFFLCVSVGSYLSFDHVRFRVDRFLDPNAIEGFQVSQAIAAFRNGGWLGRGPGEGKVKEGLPDAHADFILAVIGEEFGLIACIMLVALFLFVVLRGFAIVMKSDDLFVLLAVSGLLIQFAIQCIINMASTLNLIPPKGMTLPFVSYGGSSTLAMGITIGMVLALTRNSREKILW